METWNRGRGGHAQPEGRPGGGSGRYTTSTDAPTEGWGKIIPTPPPLPPWPEQTGKHIRNPTPPAPVYENFLYDPTFEASGSTPLKKSLRLSRTLLKGRSTQNQSYLLSRSAIKPRTDAPLSTSTSSSYTAQPSRTKQSPDGDVFRTTLQNVVKLEHARHAARGEPGAAAASRRDVDSRVPGILTCLLRAIEDLGGLEREGIFRLSGKQTEEESLISRLNDGMYTIAKGTDPHVVASVLKFWLMSLEEPLIPHTLKSACKNAKTPREALTLVESLPALHRDVITVVLEFLRTKLLLPSVVERTKMSPENLATVFGPCLLSIGSRSLASTMIVQELLADMKVQKDFTLLLMGVGEKKADLLPAIATVASVSRKRGSGAPAPYEGKALNEKEMEGNDRAA